MKSFLALILFASFFVGLHANHLSDYLFDVEADGEIPDRHPIAQCSIDLYDCIKLRNKSKPVLECLKDYKTCMSVLIPTAPPPFLQCKIDLWNCFKEGNKGNIECLKDYKTCISALMPTVPPFVETCVNNATQCVKDKNTLAMKLRCLKGLLVCIKNGKPEKVAFDVIEDMGQTEDSNGFEKCRKDFFQCFKSEKDKRICSANYNACIEALAPAYVKKCITEAKECFGGAQTLIERLSCAKQLRKCLQNGAATTSPPLPTEE